VLPNLPLIGKEAEQHRQDRNENETAEGQSQKRPAVQRKEATSRQRFAQQLQPHLFVHLNRRELPLEQLLGKKRGSSRDPQPSFLSKQALGQLNEINDVLVLLVTSIVFS
jgi:hypothetical protein